MKKLILTLLLGASAYTAQAELPIGLVINATDLEASKLLRQGIELAVLADYPDVVFTDWESPNNMMDLDVICLTTNDSATIGWSVTVTYNHRYILHRLYLGGIKKLAASTDDFAAVLKTGIQIARDFQSKQKATLHQ